MNSTNAAPRAYLGPYELFGKPRDNTDKPDCDKDDTRSLIPIGLILGHSGALMYLM